VCHFDSDLNGRDYEGMAKTVAVVMTDDLDGSPAAGTLMFGIDGVTYEIDLNEKNRARFERELSPYIAAGRRVTRSRRRASSGRPPGPRADRAAVRAWARDNGLRVSERGRISAEVISQYEAVH
jgi:Lsr2